MGFSRQEYWSGLPCPPPGNPADREIEPTSLTSPALAGGFFTTSATEETPCGPKKEPQKETKLRRFRACGLQVEVEGWAGQAKAVSSRGQRKQWARQGMHDWRPWAATGRSRKGWEACDPCQGGKEWATKSLALEMHFESLNLSKTVKPNDLSCFFHTP